MTSESRDGPTPNGGVKSVLYYLDAEGRPAEKDMATHFKGEELDATGDIIHRVYGTLSRPETPTDDDASEALLLAAADLVERGAPPEALEQLAAWADDPEALRTELEEEEAAPE